MCSVGCVGCSGVKSKRLACTPKHKTQPAVAAHRWRQQQHCVVGAMGGTSTDGGLPSLLSFGSSVCRGCGFIRPPVPCVSLHVACCLSVQSPRGRGQTGLVCASLDQLFWMCRAVVWLCNGFLQLSVSCVLWLGGVVCWWGHVWLLTGVRGLRSDCIIYEPVFLPTFRQF